jgi:hypothetical protein
MRWQDPLVSDNSGPTDAGQTAGRHAGIWSWLTAMATTVGLICVYARWGWQGVVAGALLAATLSVLAGVAVWIGDGRGLALRGGLRVLVASVLVTAGIGLVDVFDLGGVCVVLLLAGFAPQLTSLVRRRWPRRHPAAAPDGAPGRHPSSLAPAEVSEDRAAQARRVLRAIDDRTLCRSWRDSFALLYDARSTEDRLSVVQLREGYLDELCRRSPRGLAAWFASGPRASSSPLPFLTDQGSRAD